MDYKVIPHPDFNGISQTEYELTGETRTWKTRTGHWYVSKAPLDIDLVYDAETRILYYEYWTVHDRFRRVQTEPAQQRPEVQRRFALVQAFLDAHPELK
jgi:hypothetical protein